MRSGAILIWCGWLMLAAGRASAQEPPVQELPPGAVKSLPPPSVEQLPRPGAEQLPPPLHGTPHPGAHDPSGHGAAHHHPHKELTAEDVPDHEPVHPTRWRVRSEYVVWLPRDARTPALLSATLNTDPRPGRLDAASGRIVYGGTLDMHERHGGLFSAAYSFDDEHCTYLEGLYAFAGDQTIGFRTFTPGSTPAFPVLARPFFNVVTGQEDASLIGFPELVGGTVDIDYRTYFDTAELNLNRRITGGEEAWLEVLGGLRLFRLEESLDIQETVVGQRMAGLLFGRSIGVRDQFETDNTFYGAQIGFRGFKRYKRLELEVGGKIGLGVIDRDLRISGATLITGDPLFAQPAGLLALASNSGRHDSVAFGVMPEANVRLGYRFTDHFQLYFGYTFLYLNQVLRPGDQIDRNLNPNLIPTSATFGAPGGPLRPAPLENGTDFWVNGLRFGMELKF